MAAPTEAHAPYLVLRVTAQHLRLITVPIRNGVQWADLAAWRLAYPEAGATGTPRSWCYSNLPRIEREGMSLSDAEHLLLGLRVSVDGAYSALNADQAARGGLLTDPQRRQLTRVTEAANHWVPWLLEVMAPLRPQAADQARYDLARALIPFIDPPSWVRLLQRGDDPDDPSSGTWACKAGLAARDHAERAFARWEGMLHADPYSDPIFGALCWPEEPADAKPRVQLQVVDGDGDGDGETAAAPQPSSKPPLRLLGAEQATD